MTVGKFRNHKAYPKLRHQRRYLLPHACLQCRKAFRKPPAAQAYRCPHCAATLIELGRNFCAPARSDTDQWNTVAFLLQRGFRFRTLYAPHDDGSCRRVSYPATLAQAREFAIRYASSLRPPPP